MRVVWVTRSFLDYRVPVFSALDELLGGNLYVVFSSDYVPGRVCSKVAKAMGTRAIGLSGEWQLGSHDDASWANSRISFQYHPKLLKTIRRCRPDVLIGDGFFKWTLASILYKILHRTPLVVCYERTRHTEREIQWYRNAYRRAIVRIADAVCCNGRLCGEYVRALGFPENRITYGHMAADVDGVRQAVSSVSETQIFALKAKLDLKGFVFLYVGRLIPRKGIDKLLSAWKVLSVRIGSKEMTLLLVGDGPQRRELEQYCATYSLSNVRFAGAVDYDALAPFYRAADVFVIPTLEDNWSLVVPEAMACGLPILCSKYNGCWPELVHPEINGWVFDPLDTTDFVDKLRLCRDFQDRLGQLGKSSREIVEKFTPDNAAKSILTACEIALGCGRR